ncbi:hypothetical protein NIES4071_94030 [Calothrix sp. NIES-4071]|nr:hypothetical protein NIES4071_94030 [Calothrix sp. NIES-4071]BAZ63668.1 hypothetical protein NIES4105_93960 [Calothrix sp. NIES-4105]
MTLSVGKTVKVYDEIVEFIASGTTPESVIKFKLSETGQERLEDLIDAHETGILTPEDRKELDNYLVLEHIMRLAKIRALKLVSAKPSNS